MQDAAHLQINGQTILVLRRLMRRGHCWGAALKLRTSGQPGSLLESESEYLREEPELLAKLLAGKNIIC